MALRADYNEAATRKMLQERMANMRNAIISRLTLIGEQFVANARNNGDYQDITGNLRASVGFGVGQNGNLIQSGGFEIEGQGTDKVTGQIGGQTLLESLMPQFPAGFVLIGVAGMEYASLVEARGRDVITGAGLLAEQDLRNALSRFNR